MLWCALFVSVLCSVSGFTFPKPDPICDLKDFPCIANIIENMFNLGLPGVPELGILPMDPIHQELMEQNQPGLNFSLSDTTVTGFKDSILNHIIITEDENKKENMTFDLTLPHYEMSGNYKLNGEMLKMSVSGQGKYNFSATNIHLVTMVKKVLYEINGKKYLKLTDAITTTELLGTEKFHVENDLSNGASQLPEHFLKYINDNPKDIAGLWQEFVAKANANTIIANFNKMFAEVPVNELVTGHF